MPVKSVQDLLVHELQDIFHAEKQLVRALPKLAKAAGHDELRRAFLEHLEQTKGQVERLEQVFEALDKAPRGKRCEAMEGLVAEAQEALEEIPDPAVRDVALIVAAQKVEHYEIAAYGSLVALARQLGREAAAELLERTLAEEKEADRKLNELALALVNPDAGAGGAADDEDGDGGEAGARSGAARAGGRSGGKGGRGAA